MTLKGFLTAMERAVDKQRQEQASLVNCVWAKTHWCSAVASKLLLVQFFPQYFWSVQLFLLSYNKPVLFSFTSQCLKQHLSTSHCCFLGDFCQFTIHELQFRCLANALLFAYQAMLFLCWGFYMCIYLNNLIKIRGKHFLFFNGSFWFIFMFWFDLIQTMLPVMVLLKDIIIHT